MARWIYIRFNTREKVFLYIIITNLKTKQFRIYKLPSRIIKTKANYNRETVDKLLTRFEEYEKIVYDKATKEIYIKNWTKDNKITSMQVKKCVEKELAKEDNTTDNNRSETIRTKVEVEYISKEYIKLYEASH